MVRWINYLVIELVLRLVTKFLTYCVVTSLVIGKVLLITSTKIQPNVATKPSNASPISFSIARVHPPPHGFWHCVTLCISLTSLVQKLLIGAHPMKPSVDKPLTSPMSSSLSFGNLYTLPQLNPLAPILVPNSPPNHMSGLAVLSVLLKLLAIISPTKFLLTTVNRSSIVRPSVPRVTPLKSTAVLHLL